MPKPIEPLDGVDLFNYSTNVSRKLNEIISFLNGLTQGLAHGLTPKEPEIKNGQQYWFITDEGECEWYTWRGDGMDIKYRDFGNFFLSKEEAEKALVKMKELLKSLK